MAICFEGAASLCGTAVGAVGMVAGACGVESNVAPGNRDRTSAPAICFEGAASICGSALGAVGMVAGACGVESNVAPGNRDRTSAAAICFEGAASGCVATLGVMSLRTAEFKLWIVSGTGGALTAPPRNIVRIRALAISFAGAVLDCGVASPVAAFCAVVFMEAGSSVSAGPNSALIRPLNAGVICGVPGTEAGTAGGSAARFPI